MTTVLTSGGEFVETGASDPVLAKADEIMNGPRQEAYGDPVDTLRRVGVAWAPLLGLEEPVPPRVVAWCLVALKAVRDTSPGGRPDDDNPVDAAAYAAIAGRIKEVYPCR